MSKQMIWTEAYRPWIMGGDVHQPVGTEVGECEYVTVEGIALLIVTAPDGRTAICDEASGAIVGSNLNEVASHIEDGDPGVMQKQLADARKRRECVDVLEEDTFWGLWDA